MRKKVVLSIGILSVLLFVTAAYNPASAATYAVGVKIGDTSTYHLSASFSTNNKTTLLVFGIVGSVVTLNETYYHPDGSVSGTSQIIIDVNAGSILVWFYLIASGLQTNDSIYSGAPYKINDTSTMSFGGASRSVNHLKINGGAQEVWWDQQTGLMVQANILFFGWANYTLISTTAWSPSFFTLTNMIIIGAVVVVVLVVALVLLRRRK